MRKSSEAESGVVFPSQRDETQLADTTENYISPQPLTFAVSE